MSTSKYIPSLVFPGRKVARYWGILDRVVLIPY